MESHLKSSPDQMEFFKQSPHKSSNSRLNSRHSSNNSNSLSLDIPLFYLLPSLPFLPSVKQYLPISYWNSKTFQTEQHDIVKNSMKIPKFVQISCFPRTVLNIFLNNVGERQYCSRIMSFKTDVRDIVLRNHATWNARFNYF